MFETGEKYCARSGTRLFTPNTATELEVLKSWLPSRRMEYNYNFDALLGNIILQLIENPADLPFWNHSLLDQLKK